MAINVSIKLPDPEQTLQIQDVLFPGMRYGIMDAAYRLDENKTGEYMVVFAADCLGRGYEISLPKGSVELRLPIPVSEREIKFFYNYIKRICQKIGTNEFIREDTKGDFAEVASYIMEDVALSKKTLNYMEKNIDAGEYENMYIFGVMNPIAVGKAELRSIDGNLQKLEDFLHRRQEMDVYYAKPNVYKRNDESLFAIYVLPENVVTVLPYKAGLFMGPKDMQIDDWNVGFVIDDELAGTISYADFVANIKPDAEYDAEHFIISLNKKQMQKLLFQYRVEL